MPAVNFINRLDLRKAFPFPAGNDFNLYPSEVSHIIREHRDISCLPKAWCLLYLIAAVDRAAGMVPSWRSAYLRRVAERGSPEGREILACLCIAGSLADPEHPMNPKEDVL